MGNAQWQPIDEPGRYDANRVAGLRPIHQAIEYLLLPPIRLRKLKTICNALQVQIEDGGDAPEVNNQLIAALQLAVIHQVGRRRAAAVLQVIDDFARAEDARWTQAKAGTLPPLKIEPDEELDELMQTGYGFLHDRRRMEQ